jgi:glucose-6-phosphate dehydrogenase assembly protein OpcA
MRNRRRRRTVAGEARPTWQDNMPAWGEGDRGARYMQFTEIDRWRALGFDMPPDPERGTVMQRVRQMTEALDGAIDEGTGPALDLIIEAWVASWISTVETAYSDHCGVISVHRAQASQWLAESTHIARHEGEELERVKDAYLACRTRLAGEPDLAGTKATAGNGEHGPHVS